MNVSQDGIDWAEKVFDALYADTDFTDPNWWKATHEQSKKLETYLNDCGYNEVDIKRAMDHYNAAIEND